MGVKITAPFTEMGKTGGNGEGLVNSATPAKFSLRYLLGSPVLLSIHNDTLEPGAVQEVGAGNVDIRPIKTMALNELSKENERRGETRWEPWDIPALAD